MGKKSFTTGVEDVTTESNDEVVGMDFGAPSLPPATLAEQAAGRDALARVYANRVVDTTGTRVETPSE